MKVYIGPYKNWFGPYQLAEALCFWVKEVPDEHGFKRKPEWVHNFGEFLAHGVSKDESDRPRSLRAYAERPTTWLYKLLLWIDSKKHRKIKIRIDKYDTWNMESTLGMIILPMLKQLKETKHGAPYVDDADVPENLRTTAAPPLTEKEKNSGHMDALFFDRWDWVLDEMIWAFEQIQPGYDWEAQYCSGEHDTYFEATDTDENGKPTMYQMKHGPDDTFKIDHEARNAHQERMSNGFRLFGKYFQSLWD